MFYFEQLFQTALNGIDGANVTSAVLSVAGTILLLSFLYSAYEAFAAGGDVRMLAISGIKYLILGLVFASYGTVFRAVNGMFNSVADFIYNSTGVGDVFSNWMSQLAQYWQSNGNTSMWNLVTGLASGVISLGLILGAFIIFPVCYLIFTVFYAMYGSVLVRDRSLRSGLTADARSRSAVENLSCESDDVPGLGTDLRDPASPDVGSQSFKYRRGSQCQWSSQQFRGIESNDSSGAHGQHLFVLDHPDSLYCQPHCARRCRQHHDDARECDDHHGYCRGRYGSRFFCRSWRRGSRRRRRRSVTRTTASLRGCSGSCLSERPGLRLCGRKWIVGSFPRGCFHVEVSSTALRRGRKLGGGQRIRRRSSSGSGASASPMRSSSRPGQHRGFNAPHAVAWYVGYSLGSAYRGMKGGE